MAAIPSIQVVCRGFRVSTYQELAELRQQIADLGTKIAECSDDLSRTKGKLCQFLREVQRLATRHNEIENLLRKMPQPVAKKSSGSLPTFATAEPPPDEPWGPSVAA